MEKKKNEEKKKYTRREKLSHSKNRYHIKEGKNTPSESISCKTNSPLPASIDTIMFNDG